MANILDYLIWRGDIPFSSKPFNEVDAVILARISYMRLDRFMYYGGMDAVPLPLAVKKLLDPSARSTVKPLSENNIKLLTALSDCPRYSGIELLCYVSHFDAKNEVQFAAVTFRLDSNTYYVAFRGTDNTLVGWKEDFNMSFTCPVPAQGEAVRYLDSLGRKLGILPSEPKEGELAPAWPAGIRRAATLPSIPRRSAAKSCKKGSISSIISTGQALIRPCSKATAISASASG